MSETASPGWQRRDVLGGAALLALVVGMPLGIASLSAPQGDDDEPSERQRTMIGAVAATTLPRTDTPGADAVAVGDFVVLALAHGLDGTRAPAASAATPSFPTHRRKDGSLRYLDWLEAELDRAAGGDWLGHDAASRERTLTDFDATAYAQKEESPWRKLKGLILLGYYTSEIGASRELQFNLVPGRFDPKVPLGPHARAYSSDWTAVDFG